MAHHGSQEISRDESFAIMNDQVTISRVCIDITNLAARGVISHHYAHFMIGYLQSVSAGRVMMRSNAIQAAPRAMMPTSGPPTSTTPPKQSPTPSPSVVKPPPSSTRPPSPTNSNVQCLRVETDEKVDDFIRRASGAKIRVAAGPLHTTVHPPVRAAPVRYTFHDDDLIATEEPKEPKAKCAVKLAEKEGDKKGDVRSDDEFSRFVGRMASFDPARYRDTR